MKINKHRRLTKIIQVLERWAPMEGAEVAQHLAHIFNVDESEIKRNVINDLKFLRDEGELSTLYFNKHGDLISQDLEPEDSFYRVKWQLREHKDQLISGAQELLGFDTHVIADESLKDQMSIRAGVGLALAQEGEHLHGLYFECNHEIYHLSVPKRPQRPGGLPTLGLAICRTKAQYPKDMAKDFETLKNSYPDVPFIMISFNEPFLSSFELEAPLVLLFNHNDTVTFFNELNKNPVETLEIPSSQANNLLSYLSFFRDRTQTRHWTELKKEQGKDYQKGNLKDLELPIVFRLKTNTGFLLK